ncbi:MAG: DUF427 domain-containing protein [Anaerolineae bacterium]|nr:DUF427 domain-containing protein [Anaerolineae bacterium]MDW8171540.1 DUF427 domain-containing protein [Anaerolineae bacterium]
MLRRVEPGPGQESVWDYPRPPRLEVTSKRLRVLFAGVVVADTVAGYRILETSHPPTYYIPQSDILMQYLVPSPRRTFCEYKGEAHYWTVAVHGKSFPEAAWSYPQPNPAYLPIKDHLAFYASRAEACYVDEEKVVAQAGDFYGGWITQDIVGPFKGAAGTWGW